MGPKGGLACSGRKKKEEGGELRSFLWLSSGQMRQEKEEIFFKDRGFAESKHTKKRKAKGELIFLEKKRKNEGGRGSSFVEVV